MKSGEVTSSTNWFLGGWALTEPLCVETFHETKLQWALHFPHSTGLIGSSFLNLFDWNPLHLFLCQILKEDKNLLNNSLFDWLINMKKKIPWTLIFPKIYPTKTCCSLQFCLKQHFSGLGCMNYPFQTLHKVTPTLWFKIAHSCGKPPRRHSFHRCRPRVKYSILKSDVSQKLCHSS